MLTITFEDRAFRACLAELQGSLADLTPAMQSIGQQLEGRIRGRFETKTDPSGAPWARRGPSQSAKTTLRTATTESLTVTATCWVV